MTSASYSRSPSRMDFVALMFFASVTLATLPLAILAARESTRQNTCEDHLKRIAQAILIYENRSGGTLPNIRETPAVGWNALIGPHLDATPGFPNDYSVAHDWWDQTASRNRSIGELRISEFLCPSAPHSNRWISLRSSTGETFRAAPTDYVASAGAYLHTNDPSHLYRGAMAIPGRFYGASNVTAGNAVHTREVTDGTSYTLLVVEMADKPNQWHTGRQAENRNDQEPFLVTSGFSHGEWIDPRG